MGSFKDLKVWKKSRDFIKEIYVLTQEFPVQEMYGITSQIRRSTISISNNIVEGSGRNSKKEFSRFLDISFASAVETENLLYISLDLEFISKGQFDSATKGVIELQKMIQGLKKGISVN
jgi:four helix bundle protein